MMLEELERRNYTDATIRHYLRFVEEFFATLRQVPRQAWPNWRGFDWLEHYKALDERLGYLSPIDFRVGCCGPFVHVILSFADGPSLTEKMGLS
jgi:hypothetical protein